MNDLLREEDMNVKLFYNVICGQTFTTSTKGRMRMAIRKGAKLENLSTGKIYEACYRSEQMCYREEAGTYLFGAPNGEVIRAYPSEKVYRA